MNVAALANAPTDSAFSFSCLKRTDATSWIFSYSLSLTRKEIVLFFSSDKTIIDRKVLYKNVIDVYKINFYPLIYNRNEEESDIDPRKIHTPAPYHWDIHSIIQSTCDPTHKFGRDFYHFLWVVTVVEGVV